MVYSIAIGAGGLECDSGAFNRTQCRQWLVSAATFLHVGQALSFGNGLRRNTAGIMKI